MNKNIFYEAIKELQFIAKEQDISRIEKALKLGVLYEKFYVAYYEVFTHVYSGTVLPDVDVEIKMFRKELENESE